ncbi:hypothetical protein JK364_24090 [Streptomyces sp. 110]|uniref:Uncharacterized protein n=1 Tax=Streptomyces endocoffeicus TaxID=2898945 RepID=A0ABS1PSP8_9ACTN|nr:hypothetical protein [Streptomyces endocoffeicus]MBL1115456.1 hypothetical protein [Streptomyces endocoffeicus]
MTIVSEKIEALRGALIELGQDVTRLSDDELVTRVLGRGNGPVPGWARKDTADRVASLREDYERAGEDVSGLSDAELLNREVEQAHAEAQRHHNAYSMLLQDQVKHDRSVYAAAGRQVKESVEARGGMYLEAIVRRSAVPLTGLIYRISQLSERSGPKVVEELKNAAQRVQWQLDGVVTHKVLDEVARTDKGVKLVDGQSAEIQRLRDVVTAQARRLHAEQGYKGPRGNGRCECPGCEMLRDMDDDRQPGLHTLTDSAAVPARHLVPEG